MPGLNEPVTLVGHPFATIGVGEQLRSHVAALDVVRVELRVADVFGHAARTDVAHTSLVAGREVGTLAAGTRIFHINADEVPAALERLDKQFGEGRNIIVPAWELPRFPRAWVPALRRFDAVWALSRFIQDGLSAVGVASTWVGQSVEPVGGFAQPLPPRRAYGIRESAFVLLTMLDLTSRAERKNPRAVLELMRRLRAVRPLADVQLVLKAKAGEADAAAWVAELGELPPEQVHVIATPLDATATRGLIAACDMFVSLHRAEGFGRGLGEAMALGRVAMGTGWSGNLDFMTEETALLVQHRLMPVPVDAYPHGKGQSWAEPDVEHALALLLPLLDDPSRGQARATRGQIAALTSHGHRAVGLRMVDALERCEQGET